MASNDDIYNDDFSDSEQNYNFSANHQDDEQHAQKVNSRLETMQAKLDELNRELQTERKEHQATKARLEGEVSRIREEMTMAIASSAKAESANRSGSGGKSALQEELTKYKKLSESLKEKLDAALLSSSTAGALKNEFAKFCIKNAINLPNLNDASDMTDENCIEILLKTTKVIKALKQSAEVGSAVATGGTNSKPPTPGAAAAAGGSNSGAGGSHSHSGNHSHGHGTEQELLARIKNLEYELRLALGAAEDIKALKAKLLQMVERIRTEKESKLKAEAEAASVKKKMDMLGDHMEKLMTHLKHEAASKIRSMEQLRVSERENNRLTEKISVMNKKSVAKDRLILELREGSKILEDQLRLMDEKYLELRTKLDYSREVGAKKVKQAENIATELRIKFALAGNTTILDNIVLPDINSNAGSILEGGKSMGSTENGSWAVSSTANSSKKSVKGKSKPKKMSQSMSSLPEAAPEPNLDGVLEKIRTQAGQRKEWSDDKLRELTKSR